nr:MAG TPA: U1 small nuclear ribonucleoprotein [Caudoviricetes sp.]
MRSLRLFAVKSHHNACVQNASSCCSYSASCRTTMPTITEEIFVLRLFQQNFFDYCDYCDYWVTTIVRAQIYRNLQRSVHKSLHFYTKKPLQIYDK